MRVHEVSLSCSVELIHSILKSQISIHLYFFPCYYASWAILIIIGVTIRTIAFWGWGRSLRLLFFWGVLSFLKKKSVVNTFPLEVLIASNLFWFLFLFFVFFLFSLLFALHILKIREITFGNYLNRTNDSFHHGSLLLIQLN